MSVDPAQFRGKLGASPFYADWKKRFGDEAWATLEQYTGTLA